MKNSLNQQLISLALSIRLEPSSSMNQSTTASTNALVTKADVDTDACLNPIKPNQFHFKIPTLYYSFSGKTEFLIYESDEF
jgi:hypothetical protein